MGFGRRCGLGPPAVAVSPHQRFRFDPAHAVNLNVAFRSMRSRMRQVAPDPQPSFDPRRSPPGRRRSAGATRRTRERMAVPQTTSATAVHTPAFPKTVDAVRQVYCTEMVLSVGVASKNSLEGHMDQDTPRASGALGSPRRAKAAKLPSSPAKAPADLNGSLSSWRRSRMATVRSCRRRTADQTRAPRHRCR